MICQNLGIYSQSNLSFKEHLTHLLQFLTVFWAKIKDRATKAKAGQDGRSNTV